MPLLPLLFLLLSFDGSTPWPPSCPEARVLTEQVDRLPGTIRVRRQGPDRWSCTFEYTAPRGTTSVALAGGFNGWSTTATPMRRSGDRWTATIDLGPGMHSYKFVRNGDEWLSDPRNVLTEPDGFGGINSRFGLAVADPDAPVLWARFYELGTQRPFFCDRDGVRKYDFNQIGKERRNGYSWYGSYGHDVLKAYAEWSQRH